MIHLDKQTKYELKAIMQAHAITFGEWVITGIIEHPGKDFLELYEIWEERDEKANL